MKKFIILMILSLLLVSFVSAEWDGDFNDLYRRSGIQTSGTADVTNYQYANITCGTSNDYPSYMQPILTDITGNSKEDLILSCGPDAQTANSHIIVIDDGFNQRVNKIITTTLPAGMGVINYVFPYTVEDLDGDGLYEIIVVNKQDNTAPYDLSVIAYTYNTTSNTVQDYDELIIFDNTATVEMPNGTLVTLTEDMSAGSEDNQYTTLVCNNGGMTFNPGQCLYIDENIAILFDITDTNGNVTWATDLNGKIHSNMKPVHTPALGIYDMYIVNYTADVNYYQLHNSLGYLGYNSSKSYSLDGVSDNQVKQVTYVQCDDTLSTDCSVNDELLILEGGDVTGRLYDIEDGTQLHNWDSSETGNGVAWLEDRDNNTVQELCVAVFNGAGNSKYRCENLNFFHFVSNSGDINLGTQEDGYTSGRSVVIDINNDEPGDECVKGNCYDIVNSKFVVSTDYNWLGTNDMEPTYIFNGSGFPSAEMSTVASEWDGASTNYVSMISWKPAIGSDIYYFGSANVPTEVEIVPDLIEFEDGPELWSLEPVCLNTTIDWHCRYGNGCLSIDDGEYSEYNVYIDCFNDGIETYTYTSDLWENSVNNTVQCDTSAYSNSGVYEFYMEVWESGYETLNDSYIQEFLMTNTSVCFDRTNRGNYTPTIQNTGPSFTGGPYRNIGHPICLNSTVYYNCSSPGCYYDANGDSVYVRVDCDNDGTYETTTAISQTPEWSCTFTNSSQTTVPIQVFDLTSDLSNIYNTNEYIVEVSDKTITDVLNDKTFWCQASEFYDENNNLIITVGDTSTGLKKWFNDIGAIISISGQTAGFIFIIAVFFAIFGIGYANHMAHTPIISAVGASLMTGILTISGVISPVLVTILVVLSVGAIVVLRNYSPPASG